MRFDKIVLIGMMGAGKSTIGRLLAGLLGKPFYDTDQLIEERTGADISWIFDVEGEEGFRDRETAMLKHLFEDTETGAVIATGGGIVEREENIKLLKNAECVVYLDADIEQLIARVSKDKKRPLLQVKDPVQRIKDIYSHRDPVYRSVAQFVIPTGKRSPKIVAEEVFSVICGGENSVQP